MKKEKHNIKMSIIAFTYIMLLKTKTNNLQS
jgi:hypothetical protein